MTRSGGLLIAFAALMGSARSRSPRNSEYPGDDYTLRATIPAAEAFRPLKDGGCPLVNG